jgi:hypothetical protein
MNLAGFFNQAEQFLPCFVAVDDTCFNMGHLAPHDYPERENTDYLTQKRNSKQRHQ